jgi:hypothetical protein
MQREWEEPRMDRALWEKHLAQAERHVLESEEHAARQRDLIAELERDGHNTTQARQLLDILQDLLTMHIAHRDRLRQELG